jgi:regulator of sigma E protease
MSEDGQSFGVMDFRVFREEKDFGSMMEHSFKKSWLTVRMCWESIYDLLTGRYTFEAVSGPVGISQTIGEAAQRGFSTVLYITALISINLGVMNLLPLPALDGGRTLTTLAEIVTRKRMPKKVEAAINGAGLILLLALSAVVLVKDVIQLII